MRLVGITGTNGKTSTTTFLAAALAAAGEHGAPVVRATTLGYFVADERLDVPFTLDGFEQALAIGRARGATFAAVELTSEALARGLAQRFSFEVGVFTNLSHDHLDAHASPEHYLASKAQLFMHAKRTVVLNACDPASALIAQVVPPSVRIVRYGVPTRGVPTGEVDVMAASVHVDWDGTTLSIDGATLRCRALGAVFAENALAAYVGALACDVPREAAARAIAGAAPPEGRFDVLARADAGGPGVVIDYAHTPDALARTIETAHALTTGRVLLVFGAGGGRDAKKRPAMGAAAARADRVVLTTDNPRHEAPEAIARGLREGLRDHRAVLEIPDRAEAITRAVREAEPADVVVIAGKGHEREQIVGDAHLPFSDREVAKQALAARG